MNILIFKKGILQQRFTSHIRFSYNKNTAGQIFLTGGTNFGSLQRDRSAELFKFCLQSLSFFD
jgi:hypothetical protein